jgi:hypothetical protein
MKVPRSLPTGAWIAVGLVTAALVVPGASFAAATMTEIVGSNGAAPVVGVSKANQLFTGSAAPASYFTIEGATSVNTSNTCVDLGSVPAGKAAIITGFRTAVYQGSSNSDVLLYPSANCSGAVFAEISGAPGTTDQQIAPGFAVPAGTHLSWFVASNTSFVVDGHIDGYSVPTAAVTQITPSLGKHAVIHAR